MDKNLKAVGIPRVPHLLVWVPNNYRSDPTSFLKSNRLAHSLSPSIGPERISSIEYWLGGSHFSQLLVTAFLQANMNILKRYLSSGTGTVQALLLSRAWVPRKKAEIEVKLEIKPQICGKQSKREGEDVESPQASKSVHVASEPADCLIAPNHSSDLKSLPAWFSGSQGTGLRRIILSRPISPPSSQWDEWPSSSFSPLPLLLSIPSLLCFPSLLRWVEFQ